MTDLPEPKPFREGTLKKTQAELSEIFGISTTRVSQAENGDAPAMYQYALIGLNMTLNPPAEGDGGSSEEVDALNARIADLEKQISENATDGESEEVSKLNARIADLEKELDDLEGELEAVPNVDALNQRIEELEGQLEEASSGDGSSANDVIKGLTDALRASQGAEAPKPKRPKPGLGRAKAAPKPVQAPRPEPEDEE